MSTDPVREVFRALRQARPDADGATLLAEAERIVASKAAAGGAVRPPAPVAGRTSATKALGAGVTQGAMMGFADEFAGVLNAAFPVTAGGDIAANYRIGRDAAREDLEQIRTDRPVVYGTGSVGYSTKKAGTCTKPPPPTMLSMKPATNAKAQSR